MNVNNNDNNNLSTNKNWGKNPPTRRSFEGKCKKIKGSYRRRYFEN